MALATVLVVVTGAAHWYETREALFEVLDLDLQARATEFAARHAQGQPLEAPGTVMDKNLRGFELAETGSGAAVARSASLPQGTTLLDGDRIARTGGRPKAIFETRAVVGLGRVRVCALRFPASPSSGVAAASPAFVVAVFQDVREVEEEIRDTLAWTAATLGIALALSTVAAWLAARHLTRPLRTIAAAAGEIEATGVVRPIPTPGAGDELDQLAGALERAFSRLQASLERQARFAGDAAHELRTPVAAILAQAEVAARRERTPQEYQQALEAIVAAARRMQETLEALLLVARGDRDAGSVLRARADLAEVARETVTATAAIASARGVEVRLATPGAAPLPGDARLLGVLVRNLVDNAIAHSPDGGVVDVDVLSTPQETTLRVRDRGAGIPSDALPHVFERFFRADPSRSRATGGTGLGLALVRQIATLHGARASVESPPGAGVTVSVVFPIVAPGAAT
jgi:two-component system, OmpR family, sensor kinase